MSDLTEELKKELSDMYTLRDEVRVRLNLLSQDARDKWGTLETELDRLHDNAARATKGSLRELGAKLAEFKRHLTERSR